jgi:lysozyme family protein
VIFASIHSGPGLGALGGSLLVKGTDFNCTSTICYGVGAANHALLQQLQKVINSFSTLARFTPITVDGFVGAGTVNAAQLAAKVIRGQAASNAAIITQIASGGMTKEQVTASAPDLLAAFTAANSVLTEQGAPVQAVAPVQQASASAPAPVPAPAPTTTTTGADKIVDFVKSFFQPSAAPTPGGFAPTPSAPAATATTALVPAAPPKAKVPLWVWIVAGVGGVIVLGGIGYAIFGKSRASAPALAPAPAKAVGRRYRRCRSDED